jgi:protein-S-isoprenylcysteine O-methyltransferase Ste14
MEIPAPVFFLLAFFQGDQPPSAGSILFALGFVGHYAHRALAHPFQMRKSGKRTPCLSAGIAGLVNVLNGTINGLAVGYVHAYGTEWLADPRFLLGASLFVVGAATNLRSDAILRGLRGPGETGYRIPSGGLYGFVASPNYLGEIVQWGGWALATWSGAGLAFFALTIANLAPRARSNRQWYRETFPDYPRDRRALIPFVW